MTTSPYTPDIAVRDACRRMGISAAGLTPLRRHATAVFLLPEADAVARVRPGAEAARARTQFELVQWLIAHGFPSVEPLARPLEQPPYVVTLWTHYPQPDTPPPAEALGALLRKLHRVPQPPVELPPYRPLAQLQVAVEKSRVLASDDADWIVGSIDVLLKGYRQLDFPLGIGLIHGDAYPGNTLWDGSKVRLGDWDEVATGPRELDLANTVQGARYGRTAREIRAFTDAYGYDPAAWPGLSVLTGMRDLHTLGSFIHRIDRGDEPAAREFRHRLDTLRSGENGARWGIH
ncbi:phosphotransferase enzyme family protein [Streptomyces sp. NPDC058953]|uniref:phosphotransferase enzyme family protein n=1 Tax=unclassified Streptomyces TaxID=2593676 RepID=UPI0036A83245